MKEAGFPLTEEQIFAAERSRTQGKVTAAISAVRPAIEFPIDDFPPLSAQESIAAAKAIGRWERVSTVSSRYAIESS